MAKGGLRLASSPCFLQAGLSHAPAVGQDGQLESKLASYADAMVATAGLLGQLGLPLQVQGYWTEHRERSVLPTAGR